MTFTSKLRKISGLKTQNNKKENISLMLSMQFDNFIARGQERKQKFSFFPTAPLKKKKRISNAQSKRNASHTSHHAAKAYITLAFC